MTTTPPKSLEEAKKNVQQAHSSLRLAIKDAKDMHNYVVFIDIKDAEMLSEYLDVFLYE